MTYQLAGGSVNRLFNEPISAYFWIIIGWKDVIRLRNEYEWWTGVKYTQHESIQQNIWLFLVAG